MRRRSRFFFLLSRWTYAFDEGSRTNGDRGSVAVRSIEIDLKLGRKFPPTRSGTISRKHESILRTQSCAKILEKKAAKRRSFDFRSLSAYRGDMGRPLRNSSKTVRTPRRPFEKERIDEEMVLVGKYGLKNKREVWRVKTVLNHLRQRARFLLTLEPNDPRRVFEGSAILRRLHRSGVLDDSKNKLDYVLAMKAEDMLTRRLQYQVFSKSLARSVHHARVLILQRHINVGDQLVNVPSFTVNVDNEKHIRLNPNSPYANPNKYGRVKRRVMKSKGGGGGNAEEI